METLVCFLTKKTSMATVLRGTRGADIEKIELEEQVRIKHIEQKLIMYW